MKLNLTEYTMEHNSTIKSNGKFIDRELSWIEFNRRVLYCADNKSIPLMERINFLGITCSNMDEFIGVRFSGIDNPDYKKATCNKIHKFMNDQTKVCDTLIRELDKKGYKLTTLDKLDKKNKAKAHSLFSTMIFPLLTPINLGSTNDLPNLVNGQSCIIVTVKHGNTNAVNIIPIPVMIDSIYEFDNNFIMIEDIILSSLKRIFINKEITSKGYFRVIKDSSVVLDHDESKFLIERMEATIHRRQMSNPIFIQTNSDMPKSLRHIILSIFDIDKSCEYNASNILDYTRFRNIKLIGNDYYEKFSPAEYDKSGDYFSLFSAINNGDILLHHPYDSYDTVVKFIQHASIDPHVQAIKQTLYRVSSENSPIVNALCKAAINGKHVTCLIEIKARFDESRNINLIRKLQDCGVNVVLGTEYLKTHCKMCIVIREENKKLSIYSHIATGNYNEKTSKIYTDLSYFTSRKKIGMDLLNIFNILTGASTPDDRMQKIYYAPVNLRKHLMSNINREISFAKKGKKAEIFLKLNSISDPLIINELYKAANAGVQICIICRGITSIVPMKNMYVKSIVGRFLEHSRIYYFKNGGDPEYYISSADLLTRNLDRRVEILLQVVDNKCVDKLKDIIKIFKDDQCNSFEMDGDGNYIKLTGDSDCHQTFINNIDKESKIKIPKRKKK